MPSSKNKASDFNPSQSIKSFPFIFSNKIRDAPFPSNFKGFHFRGFLFFKQNIIYFPEMNWLILHHRIPGQPHHHGSLEVTGFSGLFHRHGDENPKQGLCCRKKMKTKKRRSRRSRLEKLEDAQNGCWDSLFSITGFFATCSVLVIGGWIFDVWQTTLCRK